MLVKAVKGSWDMGLALLRLRQDSTPGDRGNFDCISSEAELYKAVLCKAHFHSYMPYRHGRIIHCYIYMVRWCPFPSLEGFTARLDGALNTLV